MELNEERKMKLKKVPYLRTWANIFNYKARESRKDFLLDIGLIIIINTIIFVVFFSSEKLNNIFYVNITMYVYAMLLIFQLIALFARRLSDMGMNYGYAFSTFTFIAIPFLFGVCLGRAKSEIDEELYIKKYKKRKKILLFPIFAMAAISSVLFLAIPLSLAYDVIIGRTTMKECTDINEYEKYVEEVSYASKFMPNLNDLGVYEDAKFGYRLSMYSSFLGFYSDGISLFVTYGDNYTETKENVLNSYEFLNENEMVDESGDIQFPLTSFDYKGYTFQIVPYRNYWTNSSSSTCKSFMMIGYNDANNTILYLYFYDFDIDYLYDESIHSETREEIMHEFIDDNFIWYD